MKVTRDTGYPGYIVVMIFIMLMGASLPTLYALYSGEWRWFLITIVSFLGLRFIP